MEKKRDLMSGQKISSITGMPIYTLDRGKCIGSVKDIVYDGEHSRLVALTVEEPGIISPERRVLPFDQVRSIGRDAVMVENEGVMKAEKDVPELASVVAHKGTVTDKRVITESGNILGSIGDILIDTATGEAVSYEVTGGIAKDIGRGRTYVGAPKVVVIGRDAVIVPDETEVMLARQEPGGLVSMYQSAAGEVHKAGASISDYTKEQEINLSRGKTAGQDVYDDQGLLIVKKGDEITDLVIDHAVRTGKMHEIAMSAGVGGAAAGYEAAREKTREAGGGAGGFWQETKARATEAWSNMQEDTQRASEEMARRRVTASQKEFLRGKASATEVKDDQGNTIVGEGEVLTPLVLDNLDRAGKLEHVRLMPEGKPAEVTEEEAEHPELHVIVGTPQEHEAHTKHEHHKEHKEHEEHKPSM